MISVFSIDSSNKDMGGHCGSLVNIARNASGKYEAYLVMDNGSVHRFPCSEIRFMYHTDGKNKFDATGKLIETVKKKL